MAWWCINCKWGSPVKDNSDTYLECRRYPPAVKWVRHECSTNGEWVQQYPSLTHSTPACGEFTDKAE